MESSSGPLLRSLLRNVLCAAACFMRAGLSYVTFFFFFFKYGAMHFTHRELIAKQREPTSRTLMKLFVARAPALSPAK